MLRSMTAYGQATLAKPWGQLVVEIQSVNRRFLEVQVSLPKELIRFDAAIKKQVAHQVKRGQVSVRIWAHFTKGSPVVVRPNLPLAEQIQVAAKDLQKKLGISDLTEQFLLNHPDLLQFSEELEHEDEWQHDLTEAIDQALAPFLTMKNREGRLLQKDIADRLARTLPALKKIEEGAPRATVKLRERLTKTLEEFGAVNEEKLVREVAVYADKIDITEEIVRFRSHITQFGALLDGSEPNVGKTAEFLLQELMREINTISSKSSDVEVARMVVSMKSELERVKEQIQNVE